MFEGLIKAILAPYKEALWVLGLSGGPDSMALFKILKKLGCRFVVAHIDHGWRAESREEAKQLQDWVGPSIPFFLKRLDWNLEGDLSAAPSGLKPFKGNLEQAAREERLKFFKEVAGKVGATGLLLAHHADDLAETVFKRILEGAPLYALDAIKKVNVIDGLLVIRPLLEVTKKELVAYLGKDPFFIDATNLSPQFLRGRLRQSIFPSLSASFGKEIGAPLAAVARDAHLLQDYLDGVWAQYQPIEGPLGSLVDLRDLSHPFLLEAYIHQFLKVRHLPSFRADIKAISGAIRQRTGNFTKRLGSRLVVADRGFLFALAEKMPKISDWHISFLQEDLPLTGWQTLWRGKGVGWTPDKEVYLDFSPHPSPHLSPHPYDRFWTAHKVPAFLRSLVPLLVSRKGVVHEFLSGKHKGTFQGGWKVQLLVTCASNHEYDNMRR